jgi:hypothetical protein
LSSNKFWLMVFCSALFRHPHPGVRLAEHLRSFEKLNRRLHRISAETQLSCRRACQHAQPAIALSSIVC